MKDLQPSWEAAVGVVPCADPVGMAPRVGARHDPYEWLLQAIRTFHVLEEFGMTHKDLKRLASEPVRKTHKPCIGKLHFLTSKISDA
jgi:hypothetical protein